MFEEPEPIASTVRYHYDLGAITRQHDPKGAAQTTEYDPAGRIKRVTKTVNCAYTRFVYPPSQSIVNKFTTINDLATETYTATVYDGAGPTRAVAGDPPNSIGHYSGQFILYDIMGRTIQKTNPTEMTSMWTATGDDAAGWHASSQTYDWKGRPLLTTNNGTTKEASYGGYGCAGEEVVTITDEGTLVDIDPGLAINNVTKKRQQKIYSDSLGRTVKIEMLNWQGSNVYATTVNTYNALNQVKRVRQYQGDESSGVYQETTMTFDDFGRLKRRHIPEQQADANISGSTDHTTWEYYPDDTVLSVTDARSITTTFDYNARHLLKSVTYPAAQNLPAGILTTANVSYDPDAAGNRLTMWTAPAIQSVTTMTRSRGFGPRRGSFSELPALTSGVRIQSRRQGEEGYGSVALTRSPAAITPTTPGNNLGILCYQQKATAPNPPVRARNTV